VVYAIVLGAAALITGAALLATGERLEQPLAIAALALVAAVAEHRRVRLSPTLELSISLVPTLFAAVVFNPLAAMLVGGAAMVWDLRRQPGVQAARLKFAVYTFSGALTGATTGAGADLGAYLGGDGAWGLVLATTIGAVTAQIIDTLFCATTLWVRRNGVQDYLRTVAPVVLVSVPLYTPVVGLLAFAYVEVSPWTLPLFLAPALAAQGLFAMYQDQRRLAVDVLATNARLERANLSFASALIATLDARDRYTAGHSAAVSIYARDIAARMGLSDHEQRLAHLCGLVHDIGKIGLSAGLLEKPGPLTLDERRQMETHSIIGERILKNVEDYAEIATIVRHHHERWDGHGYPDGLAGDEIPLLSRIIAVADAYNAMTSDRPYREAMPSRVARLRLAQAVESQFDTDVVTVFEAILAAGNERYRRGISPAFSFDAQQEQRDSPRPTFSGSPQLAELVL
jgi:putative nucleotidyltransferase with HDIG domain